MHFTMEIREMLLFFISQAFSSEAVGTEKEDFCNKLNCANDTEKHACGLRQEGDGYKLKLFKNECLLLKFGCEVDEDHAYGIINMEYCEKFFQNPVVDLNTELFDTEVFNGDKRYSCSEFKCSEQTDPEELCGIRQDGSGFKVRLFQSKCQLFKFNCEANSSFLETDYFTCKDLKVSTDISKILFEDTTLTVEKDPSLSTDMGSSTSLDLLGASSPADRIQNNYNDVNKHIRMKNIIVVDGSMLNFNDNINETIDNFFASSHVHDLPIKSKEIFPSNDTRRRLIKKLGPVMVFEPAIRKPDKIYRGPWYEATLRTCFHKCPRECPETYAPVCGNPGTNAREPSLIFKNHCYMDVAQCKMKWERKGPTYESAGYEENSFLFCLGTQLHNLYRFLPVLKTLQHMGRVKKKAYFRYKLRNMKLFNNVMRKNPMLMGR